MVRPAVLARKIDVRFVSGLPICFLPPLSHLGVLQLTAKSYIFGTAVRVYWEDSVSLKGWVPNTIQAGGFAPAHIISTGFVFACEPRSLVLTTSLHCEEHGGLDPISIPWGSIQQVDTLGEEHDAK